MILDKLSSSDLQSLIGEETLARLEVVMPSVDPEVGSPDQLYSKANLSRLAQAFSFPGALRNQSVVRSILQYLTDDEIVVLAKSSGVSGGSREDLVDAITGALGRKKVATSLIEACDFPLEYIPQSKAKVQSFELLTPPDHPYKALKDYQARIAAEGFERLEVQNARFVVQMPTGSGKTRTAMELVANHLNSIGDTGTVFWLAHSEELCEQACECFVEVWEHVGRFPLNLNRVWGNGALLPGQSSSLNFVVASFQKLYAAMQRGEIDESLSRRVGLVVVDEAHKVIAPTYEEVTRSLIGSRTAVVGLTATPGRSYHDETQNEALADFFFGNIVQIPTPTAGSVIEYLRARDILSRMRMEPIQNRSTYELDAREIKNIEQFHDFSNRFLAKLGTDDVRNIQIIQSLRSYLEQGQQVLYFGTSVDQSKFVSAVLESLGYASSHIDGSTDKAVRKSLIDEFKVQKTNLLCNYGVLSTGFDAPKTNVVFIARPTQSIVLYSQMIGRGLRGPAIGGTPECTVVNVIDNIVGLPREERIYEYFSEYWA